MSEERKEEDRKRAAGGSFEQGLRKTLEKAPGMVVPSWATMQTAMAGGAAGGAAAASWRWIIGPAASVALVGGAIWYSEKEADLDSAVAPVESAEVVHIEEGGESPELSGETADFSIAADAEQFDAPPTDDLAHSEDVAVHSSPSEMPDGIRSSAPSAEPEGDHAVQKEDPVEVPLDWAELPDEKAAAFGVDIQRACVGTEIGFRMAKPLKDVRVLWNFGDGQFSSKTAPQHVFNAPGTYDITLSVTRISDGLIRTQTIENLVTIHPNPEADFTWGVSSRATLNPEVELRDRSRDAASVMWVLDGEETQEGESILFAFPRVGEHRVQLVASSPNGCQSVADHLLEVGGRFGLGGSARFSPDGDGRYDTFLPRKLMTEERPFVFRIEDGDGHIVFETTVPKAWDGSLPGDDRARPGQTFAWTAVIQGEVGPSYFSDEVVVE